MKLNLFFKLQILSIIFFRLILRCGTADNQVWTLSEEAVRLLTYSPEIRYQLVSLHIHKRGCYIFALIDISLSPKSTITFQGHFPGGTTAPGSPPPASAHSGPRLNSLLRLNSQWSGLSPSLHPRTSLLQNCSHWPLHPSYPQVGFLGVTRELSGLNMKIFAAHLVADFPECSAGA